MQISICRCFSRANTWLLFNFFFFLYSRNVKGSENLELEKRSIPRSTFDKWRIMMRGKGDDTGKDIKGAVLPFVDPAALTLPLKSEIGHTVTGDEMKWKDGSLFRTFDAWKMHFFSFFISPSVFAMKRRKRGNEFLFRMCLLRYFSRSVVGTMEVFLSVPIRILFGK